MSQLHDTSKETVNPATTRVWKVEGIGKFTLVVRI